MEELRGRIVSPVVRRADAFGFIRLLLASLVIVSHTPEIVDGNRSRELLTRVFGTVSFGELAVDGFFVISGFFIAGSFLKSPKAGDYLIKRIARIYPAFIVAWLISVFIVAPLGGGTPELHPGQIATDLMLLRTPGADGAYGAFAGQPYPNLNASMWTIQYEFRCYIGVLVLGLAGLLRRIPALIVLTVIAFGLHGLSSERIYGPLMWRLPFSAQLIDDPHQAFRLAGCFLTGASFYAARHIIPMCRIGVVVASLGLLATLPFARVADAGLAVFGGYLLFYLGKIGAGRSLRRINNPTDTSYGVYLYAWPIGKLVIWWLPGLSLAATGFVTAFLAYGAGWLSWTLVEKRVLDAVHHVRSRRLANPASRSQLTANR